MKKIKLYIVIMTFFISTVNANPHSEFYSEPNYINYLESKVRFGREYRYPEINDRPINYSLALETAQWYGIYLWGSIEQERTKVNTTNYHRNELHGQLGYRYDFSRVFLGLQAGMHTATEHYKTAANVKLEYKSHGVAGKLFAGGYISDNWTIRADLSPKIFRDGSVVGGEILTEYRVNHHWSIEGLYHTLFRDLEVDDYQSSIGFGVKYHF